MPSDCKSCKKIITRTVNVQRPIQHQVIETQLPVHTPQNRQPGSVRIIPPTELVWVRK